MSKIRNTIVKNSEKAWNHFEGSKNYNTESTAHIQFKSSDIVIDFNCICGTYSQIEGFFAYSLQCPKCKKVYSFNPFVEVVEVIEPDLNNGLIKKPEFDEYMNEEIN